MIDEVKALNVHGHGGGKLQFFQHGDRLGIGDIDHVAQLLAHFACSLTSKCDFVPS